MLKVLDIRELAIPFVQTWRHIPRVREMRLRSHWSTGEPAFRRLCEAIEAARHRCGLGDGDLHVGRLPDARRSGVGVGRLCPDLRGVQAGSRDVQTHLLATRNRRVQSECLSGARQRNISTCSIRAIPAIRVRWDRAQCLGSVSIKESLAYRSPARSRRPLSLAGSISNPHSMVCSRPSR